MNRSEAGNILALECAVGRGSLAVLRGSEVLATTRGRDASPSRAEEVLVALDQVLGEAGLTRTDVDLIAVSTGPGSYSGIRIGIATALGLKNALNIPCVGISVLEAMASVATGKCVAAVRVGKRDVAWQLFDDPERDAPPMLASESTFISELNKASDIRLIVQRDLAESLSGVISPATSILLVTDALAELLGRFASANPRNNSLKPIYLRNLDHEISPSIS